MAGDELRLEGASPTFARLLGHASVAALIGTPALDLFAPTVRTEVRARLATNATREHFAFASFLTRPDGTTFPVRVAVSVLERANGPASRVFEVEDLTAPEDLAPGAASRPDLEATGLASLVEVPIFLERRVVGVLRVGTTEAEREHVAMLDGVLDELTRSLAVVNVRLDSSPVGVALVDRDLRFLRVNAALAAKNGLPVEHHLGRRIDEVLSDLAPVIGPILRTVLDTGKPVLGVTIKGETPAAPGAERTWFNSYYPVRLPTGEVLGVGAVVTEITGFAQQAQRDHLIAEAGALMASSLDSKETLVRLARLAVRGFADWCAIFLRRGDGLTAVATAHADPARADATAELIAHHVPGHDTANGVWAAMRSRAPQLVREMSRERLERIVGTSGLARAREIGTASVIVVPIAAAADDGASAGAVVFSSGTPRRFGPEDAALAEKLTRLAGLAVNNARLYEEAQKAIRVRDEFFAIVSHDLRNPLGAINVGASLTEKLSNDHATRSRAAAIVRAARRMSTLLEDLFDVAAIDAGKLRVAVEDHEVDTLLGQVLDGQRPLALARSVQLHASRATNGVRVRCDRSRVLQVFSNLIGNALKYTPDGGSIQLTARPWHEHVRFSVTDSGPGISAAECRNVFDRFWQSRSAASGEGLGLGLYIARALVEAQNGTIWVESDVGQGATFVFTLPIAAG